MDGVSYDLELKQFLHSGSVVRNSGSLVALVVYCGHESKITLNQGSYKFKQSQIEKKLNFLLFVNIVIILTLAGIFAGRLYHYILSNGHRMPYIYPEADLKAGYYAGNAFATYYILFNSLIPLALLVTLEIGKMAYSKMME
jgi:phospholipid-transporting ATPase